MTEKQKPSSLTNSAKRSKIPYAKKQDAEFARELPEAAVLNRNLFGKNKPQ